MKQKIAKALAPEEQTIVANIQALLSQLSGGGEGSEEAEMAFEPKEGEDIEKANEDGEDDEIMKAIEETASEGATAEEDPEVRENIVQPEETSADKVAKAILALAAKASAPVRKSVSGNGQLVNALAALTMVVKKSIDRQSVVEESFAKVLDGLGVTKQLDIYAKEEVRKASPVVDGDNARLVKALTAIIQAGAPAATPENSIHKSQAAGARDLLSDKNVLAAMLGVK